jgi:hypothetical protein
MARPSPVIGKPKSRKIRSKFARSRIRKIHAQSQGCAFFASNNDVAGPSRRRVLRVPNWLNIVANKQDYLARLQVAVSQLHNCGAVWRETVPVHEVFRGQTVWKGEVEVYDLTGHPKAKRAYAWSHLAGKGDERERFVAVLEIPPAVSAETAVRVQIVKDVKSGEKKPRR